MRRLTTALMLAALAATAVLAAGAQTQTPPVPRPFPGSSSAPPAAPVQPAAEKPAPTTQSPPVTTRQGTSQVSAPQAPQPQAAVSMGSDPMLSGAPLYPKADLLDSYDAGQGQKYFIFGTTASFLEVITFYKATLRNSGRELFKAPAMQQFDLSKYTEDAMAYPPSVVVKDYTWNGSAGYLYVKGRQERRYPTIIQIVPR